MLERIKERMWILLVLVIGALVRESRGQDCSNFDIISPDKFPESAPICPEYAELVPVYSMPLKCSVPINKLSCNIQRIGNKESTDWDSDDLDVLCFQCAPYTKYIVEKLSDAQGSGCWLLAEYVDSLCQIRQEASQQCPIDEIVLLINDYFESSSMSLASKCSQPSCCDEEYLLMLQSYFEYSNSEMRTELSQNLTALDLSDFTVMELCREFRNVTGGSFELATFTDTCLGPSYDVNPTSFQWNPYFIPESISEGTTECDSTTAINPAEDETCPSWNSLISTAGISGECIELVNNIRCNMDSLSSGTESNFFKTSEVESLCTGSCAPYSKYIVEKLEENDDPGCSFIREFLQGTCTLFTYLGSEPELCINRGSAILNALKEYTADPETGMGLFQSACNAYSCCEDKALAVLPHYFDISESMLEVGFSLEFPSTVASDTITVRQLCTEKGFDSDLARNGDSCVSSFVLIDAASGAETVFSAFDLMIMLVSSIAMLLLAA